jgi:Protein of unknown function (DUF1236)
MFVRMIGKIAIPIIVLGSAVTVASAQTTTTTTTVETRRDPITLTPQQRTVIYRTVKRGPPVAVPADVTVRRGAVIPPAVVLSSLPETVYTDVPQLPQYKYFYVNNQLVLVDPVTSQVVDIIDQ